MPNRILREGIITSERVNSLDWPAEVFYRRLHSVVDDFGRYYAKPELLRAACYPLQLDKVGNPDVGKWLLATRKAALVRTYTVNGTEYLEIVDFRQQVRAKQSKFPPPPDICISDATQVHSSSTASAHLDVDVDVDVDEKSIVRQKPPNGFRVEAMEVLNFLNEKADRSYKPVPANLDLIVARLKDGATLTELRQVVAKKTRDWKGDEKMGGFLRPKTLFNRTNFAQYQGELLKMPETKDGMPGV